MAEQTTEQQRTEQTTEQQRADPVRNKNEFLENDWDTKRSLLSEESILAGGVISLGRKRSKRKKLTAALLILTGVLCLAGVGIYFYGKMQSDTAREYDGVLVQEIQPEKTAQEEAA